MDSTMREQQWKWARNSMESRTTRGLEEEMKKLVEGMEMMAIEAKQKHKVFFYFPLDVNFFT